jgi:RNA polymerase sigma-70 factor, ECF subfamily
MLMEKVCDPHEVIALMAAGDMAALDRMTRCYGKRLIQVGRRYCRNEIDAEDAVQDALLAAGTHLDSFRGDGSLEGWLVRMVVNACHRMRRGRKNDPALHSAEVEVQSAERSPEDATRYGEMMEIMGEALNELPPRDRLIVLLAEAEGWTGPQIAEELKMTPGSVRTRLSRARAIIRENIVKKLGVNELN